MRTRNIAILALSLFYIYFVFYFSVTTDISKFEFEDVLNFGFIKTIMVCFLLPAFYGIIFAISNEIKEHKKFLKNLHEDEAKKIIEALKTNKEDPSN